MVESDFFSWVIEYEKAEDTLRSIAEHVASFDWNTSPEAEDTLATLVSVLYQTVIPAEERRQLGEYYTPDWLAAEIVRTAVTDPLNHRVLDPACGSGSFLVEAIRHFIASAAAAGYDPSRMLTKLQRQVTGIDVHPVAVHLARAAWVIAARRGASSGRRLPVPAASTCRYRCIWGIRSSSSTTGTRYSTRRRSLSLLPATPATVNCGSRAAS